MNEVQTKIAELQGKGWTLSAIADALDVTPNAVEKWKAGSRNPQHLKQIIAAMESLSRRKRIPKMRRYSRERT